MANETALSLAFIERQPLSAARTISAMDPIDAAALLDSIPTRFGALLISKMPGWPTALILTQVSPETGAALMQAIPYQDAMSILRLLPPDRCDLILDGLPEKLRKDFQSSLSFPVDTVGARMTPKILAIEANHTAGDALDLIKRSPKDIPQVLYIVSETRKLIGIADIADLLHYRRAVTLDEIMRPPPPGLSARALLSTIADDIAWYDSLHLPVLSRRKHLIGALSRKAAVRNDLVYSDNTGGDTLIGAMVEAFFVTATGLAQLLVNDGTTQPRRRRK